jgi:hypothetical protein
MGRNEFMPGEPAPCSGCYEELNVFGAPIGEGNRDALLRNASELHRGSVQVMTSPTVVVVGSMPSVVARVAMSFSVSIPMKPLLSPTGRQPMLLSRIRRAASASVVVGVVHSMVTVINSRNRVYEAGWNGNDKAEEAAEGAIRSGWTAGWL